MSKQNKKIKPSIDKKSFLSMDIGRVSFTEKAIFAKNLSVMLQSGIVVGEALEIAVDSSKGKFKKVLKGVLKSIQSGQTLSASFARYPKVFPSLFVSTTQAGELSGTLSENLDNIATQMKKERELVSKVKSVMLYPIVVLVAAFVLGMAVSFLVLPKITPLFAGLKIDLPFSTKVLIYFSGLVQENGLLLFGGIIIFVMFLMWLVKQKFAKPVTHWLFIHTPIIKKISRGSNISRFCLTLGTLLKSGINIDEAVEITHKAMDNYYYSEALARVSRQIGKGRQLSDNLSQFDDIFPVMVLRMIKVGEQSGKLEETLLYLADFYDDEVNNATKSLTTAIEPILLIFIGLIVGFLALSIITPIYNITGGIKR